MENFQHDFANVNGQRLHFVSSGQGRVILFVHGFPEFWYEWKNQLIEFGRDHRAVALDMRGYNLSSKPAEVEQYQLNYLVEDLRALVKHLGAERLVLVGHDWGGVVAWVFAAQFPELLEKLVIINAPHPVLFQRELRDNPAQQMASQYMLMFRSAQAEAFLSANNHDALVSAFLKDGLQKGHLKEDDRKAYLEAWSQPGALTGGLNYYRAAQIGPPTPENKSTWGGPALDPSSLTVKVPTLVIWGEKDTRCSPEISKAWTSS
jgi:pimeloyl-ACP methyl ester carboxylesterase